MSNSSKDNRKESFTIWNNDEDKELYSYAARLLGQWALNTVAVLLIAIALKMVPECLLMLGSFLLIRKFAGGYHSKSFAVCFLSSVLILTGGLLVIRYAHRIPTPVFIGLDLIAVIILSVFAPAENPNKPLVEIEKKRFHMVTIVFSFVLVMLGLIAQLLLKREKTFFSISVGVIIAGIIFCAGKVDSRHINQMKNNSENKKEC